MDFSSLVDGRSAAVVIGGTLLATLLRSGPRDCITAVRGCLRLCRRRFDPKQVRAELARQARDIQVDGLLRAAVHHFGDREFDEATEALLKSRSIDALLRTHEVHRAQRQTAASTASSTIAQAAELAPVFGLVGTLVSLSQLPSGGLEAVAFTSTISMAVLTTLYGLLLANLVFAPLSRALGRAVAREEAQREILIDWLAQQIEPAKTKRSRLDSGGDTAHAA